MLLRGKVRVGGLGYRFLVDGVLGFDFVAISAREGSRVHAVRYTTEQRRERNKRNKKKLSTCSTLYNVLHIDQ